MLQWKEQGLYYEANVSSYELGQITYPFWASVSPSLKQGPWRYNIHEDPSRLPDHSRYSINGKLLRNALVDSLLVGLLNP